MGNGGASKSWRNPNFPSAEKDNKGGKRKHVGSHSLHGFYADGSTFDLLSSAFQDVVPGASGSWFGQGRRDRKRFGSESLTFLLWDSERQEQVVGDARCGKYRGKTGR